MKDNKPCITVNAFDYFGFVSGATGEAVGTTDAHPRLRGEEGAMFLHV